MKRRIIVWLAIIAMLITSVLLINYKTVERWLIGSYQPKITATTTKQAERKPANYNYDVAKQPTWTDILKARQHANQVATVGVIAIPSINLYLPIGKGVSNTVLALAVGTMRSDQVMGDGNYALAGHNMDDGRTLFSPLYSKGQAGQMVYLTNFRKVYAYQFVSRETIAPTEVSVVANTTDPVITLLTCDYTGSHRIFLRGKLVKTYTYAKTPDKIKTALTHTYNQ